MQAEIFYKRRLANYNFTIYNLGTREGHCFLSHEGQTGRGACEIASCLKKFLEWQDAKGVKVVEFFCDGCVGQNKNSILPGMMMSMLASSKNINDITINYIATNHGQSEGDVMHSVIEKRLRQHKEIFHPVQLTTVCKKMAREKAPFTVTTVTSSDVLDWKQHSQRRGILRNRTSEDGLDIVWTKFMVIKVVREKEDSIFFKNSHTEESIHPLLIEGSRRNRTVINVRDEPQCLYEGGSPKLYQGKYDDLMTLCQGRIPVIAHPDYQAFYRQLPH